MRNTFANALLEIAALDQSLVLLSGDIGNRLFDPFKHQFPKRFYNCGVAEANMAGMAAGLAMCGFRPITYTITPFNTTRCLEQIRNDICYHKVPVLIVGTGAGLSYASLGCTHHSCEDISFLRSLPNMAVLCPGDALELKVLLKKALSHAGPVYMRIGKTGEPLVHHSPPALEIGKGYLMQEGKEICFLSTGNMLPIAMDTAKQLSAENIFPEIFSFPTVKPLDTELLSSLSAQFSVWVSFEEHSLIGGFSSAIAEWMIDQHIQKIKLLRCGTPDRFPHPIGSQNYLRAEYGLTPKALAERIIQGIRHENASCHSG